MPLPGDHAWPVEPFQSKFKDAMLKLEMPRFCRRYPKLTDVLLQQMLALVQARPSSAMLCLHVSISDTRWMNPGPADIASRHHACSGPPDRAHQASMRLH